MHMFCMFTAKFIWRKTQEFLMNHTNINLFTCDRLLSFYAGRGEPGG